MDTLTIDDLPAQKRTVFLAAWLELARLPETLQQYGAERFAELFALRPAARHKIVWRRAESSFRCF